MKMPPFSEQRRIKRRSGHGVLITVLLVALWCESFYVEASNSHGSQSNVESDPAAVDTTYPNQHGDTKEPLPTEDPVETIRKTKDLGADGLLEANEDASGKPSGSPTDEDNSLEIDSSSLSNDSATRDEETNDDPAYEHTVSTEASDKEHPMDDDTKIIEMDEDNPESTINNSQDPPEDGASSLSNDETLLNSEEIGQDSSLDNASISSTDSNDDEQQQQADEEALQNTEPEAEQEISASESEHSKLPEANLVTSSTAEDAPPSIENGTSKAELQDNPSYGAYGYSEQREQDYVSSRHTHNLHASSSAQRSVSTHELAKLSDGMDELDDRSLLDVFAEVSKEYLTQKVIPPTDEECRWDWRSLRCEPACECRLEGQWGDYHLGRSCRLLSEKDAHCVPVDPSVVLSEAPVPKRVISLVTQTLEILHSKIKLGLQKLTSKIAQQWQRHVLDRVCKDHQALLEKISQNQQRNNGQCISVTTMALLQSTTASESIIERVLCGPIKDYPICEAGSSQPAVPSAQTRSFQPTSRKRQDAQAAKLKPSYQGGTTSFQRHHKMHHAAAKDDN